MKKLVHLIKTRRPLPYQTAQTLYGVSIVLALVAAGRLNAVM